MKAIAILTAAAMGGAPSPAGYTVELTQQQAAACEQGGGCPLVTEQSLQHMKLNVFMEGFVMGAQGCGGKSI